MNHRARRKPQSTLHAAASDHRRGAAAVEFAIVAPLLFLLLAGIIEFGQAFRIEHVLSNASRRGARAAIVNGAASSDVRKMVQAHCERALGVKAAHVTVKVAVNGSTTGSLNGAGPGDEVSVSVSIPFSKAGAGFFASLFASATLESSCTLEYE